MDLLLDNATIAEAVPGAALPLAPRLGLRSLSLLVGPYRSGDEHEAHVLATIGSGSWHSPDCEEFRFDPHDRVLRSVWLHLPETKLGADDFPDGWGHTPPTPGLLRLGSPPPFGPERPTRRWVAPSGALLASVDADALVATNDRRRLRIAPDLDLLFARRRYCGWLLTQPARYLIDEWEEVSLDEPSVGLAAQLRTYLELVAEPNIARMEAGDPALLAALRDLAGRLTREARPTRQHGVLQRSIVEIIDQFYGA
jgi:hypothetical protein